MLLVVFCSCNSLNNTFKIQQRLMSAMASNVLLLFSLCALSFSEYTLTDLFQGETFFDNFDFYSGADPVNLLLNFSLILLRQMVSYTTPHVMKLLIGGWFST